jgi:hypothetical protein
MNEIRVSLVIIIQQGTPHFETHWLATSFAESVEQAKLNRLLSACSIA